MDLLEFQSLTAGYNDIPVTTEISLAVGKAGARNAGLPVAYGNTVWQETQAVS